MTDSKQILTCPACGKQMQKIIIEKENMYIDVCTEGCGGIFFDNREYKKFNENNEHFEELEKILATKNLQTVDNTYKRICPVCKKKMIKNSTSIKNQIFIDECYNCGGKFIDYNELKNTKKEYATDADRSNEVMEYLKTTMGKEFEDMHKPTKNTPKKNSIVDKIINKFF